MKRTIEGDFEIIVESIQTTLEANGFRDVIVDELPDREPSREQVPGLPADLHSFFTALRGRSRRRIVRAYNPGSTTNASFDEWPPCQMVLTRLAPDLAEVDAFYSLGRQDWDSPDADMSEEQHRNTADARDFYLNVVSRWCEAP